MTHVLVFLDTDEVDIDILAVSDDVDKLKAAALSNERNSRQLDDDEAFNMPAWELQQLVDGARWVSDLDEFGKYVISEPAITRV